jgi:hypothetical protein
MTDAENLTALRNKLITRRRQLVAMQAGASIEQLSADSIARVQEAIDAIDRAIIDESAEVLRRRVV